jgi:hypothetical protein
MTEQSAMTRILAFMRSELVLSVAGGFALGLAAMALVKPASATQEKVETRTVLIEEAGQGASYGQYSR